MANRSVTAILTMAVAASTPAVGGSLDQQAAALREIRATAGDICQTAPLTQQSSAIKLTAAADAKLAAS